MSDISEKVSSVCKFLAFLILLDDKLQSGNYEGNRRDNWNEGTRGEGFNDGSSVLLLVTLLVPVLASKKKNNKQTNKPRC